MEKLPHQLQSVRNLTADKRTEGGAGTPLTVLVLYEQNEFALYSMHRQLLEQTTSPTIPVLASIHDKEALRGTIREHAIDVVLHAAAHKHVPLLEANALEVFETMCSIRFQSLRQQSASGFATSY
jgi:hypothetical protein